jgi:murein DD-endopeptidase MepM/ murein hydrolase activator NlpD
MKSEGRECYRTGRYRNFCQGPRRVPRPNGSESLLAKNLNIGDIRTASHLLLGPPNPEWVSAAGTVSDQQNLLWPVSGGKLWRGFGQARCGAARKSGTRKHRHEGIDIGASEGTLFRAVANGIVVYADNKVRGYGNLLVVVHPDSSVAFYAHAKALYLFPGQKVRRGQVLGEVGHTGIARGSHLHFEYRINGRSRDPIKLFEPVDFTLGLVAKDTERRRKGERE